MNKKLIITGGVLILISGGLLRAIVSSSSSEHTYTGVEHYYNNDGESPSPNSPTLEPENSNFEQDIAKDVELDLDKNSLTCLVNKEYPLPADYVPDDLILPNINFNISYYAEKKLLRNDAALAIEKLFSAAEEEGITLYGVSGYRSYKRQEEIYQNNLKTKGTNHTNLYSAKPGYSEHQTGLSMDVSSASIGYQLIDSFGTTVEGQWLAQNCHLYGFIIRYPEDKTKITGYAYEPWHIRYVGQKLATYLFENKLTMEEYYNAIPSEDDIADDLNETTVDVEDNSPSSLAPIKPSVHPSTSVSPEVTCSVSPTPIPTAPSAEPSVKPTKKPSTKPSKEPTVTKEPTTKPTPTQRPSVKPSATVKPSASIKPSPSPSATSTSTPTTEPNPTTTPDEDNINEVSLESSQDGIS